MKRVISLVAVLTALIVTVSCAPTVTDTPASSSSVASVFVPGNTTTLSNTIDAAIVVSTTYTVGTGNAQVSQSVMDTFTNAIAVAEAYRDAFTTTIAQGPVDAATAALVTAQQIFLAAVYWTPLYNPDFTTFNYSDNHGDYIDEEIAIGGWNVSVDMSVSNDMTEGKIMILTQLANLAWGTYNGADVAGGFALVQRPDNVFDGLYMDMTKVSNITFELKSSEWSAADLKWLVQGPNSLGATEGAELQLIVSNEAENAALTVADNAWHTVTLNVYDKGFTNAKNPVTFLFNARTDNVSQMFIKNIQFIGFDGNAVTKTDLNFWN